MKNICIYPMGITPGCQAAGRALARAGIRVVDHPSPEVSHLLLDVPSFLPDGRLRGGGDPKALLEMLPEDLTVIGGKLRHPSLAGYQTMDLLADESYLAENAAITADCALSLARPLLERTFRDAPSLILGWGRIGKCLSQMLKALGCPVTVAARKEEDRGMLRALGYEAVGFDEIQALLPDIRLLFNTVPQKVLETDAGCVKIDLASVPGIWGEDVVCARGLPGIHAPESVGQLMARTILKHFREEII